MYIVIHKVTDKTAVIKDKTELSYHLGISLSTIYRRENKRKWETDNFIVYVPDKIAIKSRRGGNRK